MFFEDDYMNNKVIVVVLIAVIITVIIIIRRFIKLTNGWRKDGLRWRIVPGAKVLKNISRQ